MQALGESIALLSSLLPVAFFCPVFSDLNVLTNVLDVEIKCFTHIHHDLSATVYHWPFRLETQSLIIVSRLSLHHEGRWGTTDDFAISFLHFSLFSTALLDLANSWPDHSLTLSSHLFLCLPCLLPPFTVPCKMVFPRSDNQETWPYHCSLRLFTMVRRSSCDPIACWILARPSSLWVCLQKAAEHTPINDPTIQQPDDQHSISVSCATKDSKYLGSLVLSRTGN